MTANKPRKARATRTTAPQNPEDAVETIPVPPLVPPMVNSNLLKVHRAASGDDYFAGRVEAACWFLDMEYEPSILWKVAHAVVDSVDVDAANTVSTNRVTDEAILQTLETIKSQQSVT